MALNLTTAGSALKEFYLPAVREQLNNLNVLLAQVEKNTVDVEGRRAVLSLHVRRNSSVGARVEGGTLPGSQSGASIGNQGYAEERVPLKYNYARIQISGPVIKAMKSDRGSFIRAVNSETRGAVTDLKTEVNRQLWGDTTGIVAGLGTNAAVNVLDLATTATRVDQRYLEVGMVIDIGTATVTDSIASSRTITAVDFSTLPGNITISGAAVSTTDGTDFIYRGGLNPAGDGDDIELTGIRELVSDTGALFNVDPSVEPAWASTVDDNGGTKRSVSENLFAKLMHDVQIKGGGSGTGMKMWMTSDGVHRAYANLLTALKRFPSSLELKGGFKGLDIAAGGNFDSVTLVWDRFAPACTAFYVDTDHLKEHQSSDWEYMDMDGAVLSRVSAQDAYEATLFKYHELTTDKRNAHGRINDLTEA